MSLADREYQRLHRMDENPHKEHPNLKKCVWTLVVLALLCIGILWYLWYRSH